MKKYKNGSYIDNCLVVSRADNKVSLFEMKPDMSEIIIRLDGYAIVPLEEYEMLKNLLESILKIKESRG